MNRKGESLSIGYSYLVIPATLSDHDAFVASLPLLMIVTSRGLVNYNDGIKEAWIIGLDNVKNTTNPAFTIEPAL